MKNTVKNLSELPISFSPAALTSILGISRAGAYRLASRDDFPKIYIGRRIVIMREQFIDWLTAQHSYNTFTKGNS